MHLRTGSVIFVFILFPGKTDASRHRMGLVYFMFILHVISALVV